MCHVNSKPLDQQHVIPVDRCHKVSKPLKIDNHAQYIINKYLATLVSIENIIFYIVISTRKII